MSKSILVVLAALVLAPLTAQAHHGWAGNEEKISEITGVVTTAVSLGGPHATMKIKDAQGNIWDVTMAPPARTQDAGLKEGMIPVGATVMVHGHRSRDMKRYEMKVTRVTHNGKVYAVYPNMD
jgi:hypothetical protein